MMWVVEFKSTETGKWDSPMYWVPNIEAAEKLAQEIAPGQEFRVVEVEFLRVVYPK